MLTWGLTMVMLIGVVVFMFVASIVEEVIDYKKDKEAGLY